ncbi:SRPBCC family protein [Streptomyces sp. NPDC089919]|uniref:SRPBCC family protein n=1 Tax=Streptomyces sp. NPDC089919 TaxID=3155188 RepID=UPI00343ECFF0
MPLIRIVHTADVAPYEAWRRLTDWERHGAQVPFTVTFLTTAPPTAVGTRFTARTGFGRLSFDDPMEVVAWRPPAAGAPGHVRLEKHGRLVLGWAEIEVRPAPAGGSEVHWREELRVRGLPRLLDAPLALAGRALFGRALGRLLAG